MKDIISISKWFKLKEVILLALFVLTISTVFLFFQVKARHLSWQDAAIITLSLDLVILVLGCLLFKEWDDSSIFKDKKMVDCVNKINCEVK